jgi:hypothetical protein
MAEIDENRAEIERKKAENKRVTKQVKKFMNSVKDFLMAKNGGKIPPEWGCSLMMLETYYSQFIRLTYEIDTLPSLIEMTRYGAAPSPLLKARDSTAVRLESLMKGFGLTMKSAMGMEIVEPVVEESPLESFVKNKIEKR